MRVQIEDHCIPFKLSSNFFDVSSFSFILFLDDDDGIDDITIPTEIENLLKACKNVSNNSIVTNYKSKEMK